MFIKEIAGSLVWIVVGSIFILQALQLPTQRGATMGAAFFPTVLCGLIIIFSLVNIIVKILHFFGRGRVTVGHSSDSTPKRDKISEGMDFKSRFTNEIMDFRSSLFSPMALRVAGLVLILVSYLFLMPRLGYVISTICFSLTLMFFHGMRKPYWLLGGSVLIAFSILVVFQYWLKVPLPKISLF